MDYVRRMYKMGTFAMCRFQYEREPECAVSMYKMQKDRIGSQWSKEHSANGIRQTVEEKEFWVFEQYWIRMVTGYALNFWGHGKH